MPEAIIDYRDVTLCSFGQEPLGAGLVDVPDGQELDPGGLLVGNQTRLIVQNPGTNLGSYALTWVNPANNKQLKLRAIINGSPSGGWLNSPVMAVCSDPWPKTYVVKTTGPWAYTDKVDVVLSHSVVSCTDTVRLVTIKVDLEKVWSDQLPGVEWNYLPGGGGASKGNGDVFLMIGARADNKVYIEAQTSVSPDTPEVRSKLLFRLAKIDPDDPANVSEMSIRDGVSTLAADGVASVVSSDFSVDFHKLLAGIDINEDGKLSKDEVCTVSPHRMRLVGQGRYFTSGVKAEATRTGFAVAGFFLAEEIMDEFLRPRLEGTYTHVQIAANDSRLEHRVGLKLAANGIDSTAQELVIGASHAGSLDVAHSLTLADLILLRLGTKKTVVTEFFADPKNAEETYYLGYVDVEGTVDYGTHPVLDAWAWVAFGKAEMDAICIFRVDRASMKVDLARISGVQTDLYDWDYTMGDTDEPFACRQAGFPTLGDSGRVLKTLVELSHDIYGAVVGYDMSE